jgi:glycosyltransferase involved in cell wall biosynthesis
MEARFTTDTHNGVSRKPPAISIAMAVYNGARFLPAMLDSLAGQTLLPDELVVCDNCSTDDSRAIIEEFARRAPFAVKLYVNKHNLGPDANFERAFGLCTKEIIFPADCDDVWLPHKVATMAAHFAESDEIGLVMCDREMVDENLRPLGRTWCGNVGCGPRVHRGIADGSLGALLRTQLGGNVMAFRACFLPLILPIDEPWYVGYDIWIGLIVGSVARVVFVPEPLVLFRLHPHQASQKMMILDRSNYFRRRTKIRPVARYLLSASLVLKRLLVTDNLRPPPRALGQIADLAAHWMARMALPPAMLPRFAAVVVELASLRYYRYSHGFRSAIKDVIFGGADFDSGKVSTEPWFTSGVVPLTAESARQPLMRGPDASSAARSDFRSQPKKGTESGAARTV